jgi:hypothetical protein
MSTDKQHLENVKTDLELDEHLPMHEKGFKVQIFGLLSMLLLVLLAAIGLFGDGALSRRTDFMDNVKVEYQRFYRHEARMEFEINVTDVHKQIIVSFPSSYLKEFEIESILPAPESNNIEDDKIRYVFPGNGDMNLIFFLVPREVGNIEGVVEVGTHAFSINHFIYP